MATKKAAAKQTAVAKPAVNAKAPSRAVLQSEITQLKAQVAALGKHKAGSSAKSKATKASAKHSTKRGWSPDEGVALCSARAVAEALRLASGPVLSDSAVLDLYWSVASDADAGAAIWATLAAAQGFGYLTPELTLLTSLDGPCALADVGTVGAGWASMADRAPGLRHIAEHPHALILGLDLPGGEPHAVTYDPASGAWWSWGEPHTPADFPGAVIEEAWAVTW